MGLFSVCGCRGVSPIHWLYLFSDGLRTQQKVGFVLQLKKTSHRSREHQSTLGRSNVHNQQQPAQKHQLFIRNSLNRFVHLKKMKLAILGSLVAVATTVVANDQYQQNEDHYEEVIPE